MTDVTAKCRVIKAGKTMLPVEVNLYDSHGRHVAVAQVNYMCLSGMTGR
jgi:acyl-coenzyme A thioesterase PaaI-like protein